MPPLRPQRAGSRGPGLQPVPRPGLGTAAGALLRRKALLFAGWGWAAAIVVLSLVPVEPKIDVGYGDKLGHFAAYGLLMFLFCQIYARRVAFALGFVAMGIALEFLQGLTDSRTFDVVDMLANAAGVALGWAAAVLLRSSRMPE